MAQDQETGARAVEYGLETARKIAVALGAEKVGNPRSNEYQLQDKVIVIKCARCTTNSVGVPYHMLDRISAIFGSFETEDGRYSVYEMSPDTFRKNMRPTRSTGPSAGRVGIVRKSAFFKQGSLVTNLTLK